MIKKTCKVLLSLFVMISVYSCAAAEPGVIKSVRVEQANDGEYIKIILSVPCEHRYFMLEGPPRFVIDLTGVVTEKETAEVGNGIVKSIRRAQFEDKPKSIARLVADLNVIPAKTEVQELNNSIIIKFYSIAATNTGSGKETSVDVVEEFPISDISAEVVESSKDLGIDLLDINIPGEEAAIKDEKLAESVSVKEYILNIDDVLEISVWGDEAMIREVTVRPDGMISFMLVGDVQACGFTPTRLARQLEEKLSVYIKKPMVTVIVKKATKGRREVFLLGEVRNSGSQELGEGMGILELLSKAGGLTENAFTKSIKILRKEPSPYAISVNLNEIINGDFSKNETLKPNDVIYIPRSEGSRGVFILGQIERPGMYKTEEAPTIIELVSKAGGFKDNAVPSSVKVIRGEPGKPEVLSANIDLFINTGDMSTNITLQPGDIVYVPKSFISNMNKFFSDILPTIQFVYYGYSLGKGIAGVP